MTTATAIVTTKSLPSMEIVLHITDNVQCLGF